MPSLSVLLRAAASGDLKRWITSGVLVQIRQATLSDSAAIADLLKSLGYPDNERFIESRVEQQLTHPDAKLLVAVEDSSVLGFVSLHFIPQVALEGDFCRISYFCVSESSRSKGVGAALEEAVTALARERACDRIEVHCHSRRVAAHKFYNRQGYSVSPEYLLKLLK
jgi:GNAT superfamily N-acetyltransferase